MLNQELFLVQCADTVHSLYTERAYFSIFQGPAENVTEWSEWSGCSLSCDGGITRRHRCTKASCLVEDSPKGTWESQHKICNMHSCLGSDLDKDQLQKKTSRHQELCDQHNQAPFQVLYLQNNFLKRHKAQIFSMTTSLQESFGTWDIPPLFFTSALLKGQTFFRSLNL